MTSPRGSRDGKWWWTEKNHPPPVLQARATGEVVELEMNIYRKPSEVKVPSDAKDFLEVLDPHAERFTFQTFPEKNEKSTRRTPRLFHKTLNDAMGLLCELNENGSGIFVSLNETDFEGRKTDNIIRVRAVFVDLDGAPLDPVLNCNLRPHLVTETSPGRHHAFWLVDGFPLDQFKPVQKAIAARFDGDAAVSDLPRCVRVPGFDNVKSDPFKARIVEVNDGPILTAEEILSEFPPSKKPSKARVRLRGGDVFREGERNSRLVSMAGTMRRRGMSEAAILAALIEENDARCSPPLDDDEVDAIAESVAQYEPDDDVELILDPAAPMVSAQEFVARRYLVDGQPTLRYWRGGWHRWSGRNFPEVDAKAIRGELYRFLNAAVIGVVKKGQEPEYKPFNPNRAKVDNVLDALVATVYISEKFEHPGWLEDGDNQKPVRELIACQNGLLHIPTAELIPHSPNYFNINVLPFDYDPEAPEPKEWFRFLDSLWPDDDESTEVLQEAFGYFLTHDTSHQKIFLLVGPPRSGKGTIARTLTAILGQENVAGPTLSSLSTGFGLSPLIGKQMAVISDARMASRGGSIVTERLLSISGEDSLTVDRKYKSHWTGKLDARLLILTNELPQINDASGALSSRFIILRLIESYVGRVDIGLLGRLLKELPGVLNWSLDGLRYLTKRGHFVMPKSSKDALQQLEDLSSPTGAFLRDECCVAPNESMSVDEAWEAWKRWAGEQGLGLGTKQKFGRDLHAAVPTLRITKRTIDGRKQRVYGGVSVK